MTKWARMRRRKERRRAEQEPTNSVSEVNEICLLYTSDAADE